MINCGGKILDLSIPRVMGILNITTDSFYDGGKYQAPDRALQHAGQMLEEGASIIDIGACSSRPGARDVPEEEEKQRLLPVVESLAKTFPEAVISADTFRASVAREAVGRGADMINDISGGSLDPQMFPAVAALQVPYILMHMRGTPATMQHLTGYNDVIYDQVDYFSEKIGQMRALGVHDIIIDPGFGFAKTRKQSFELLGRLKELTVLGLPLLAGMSRKSMLYKTLGGTPDDMLNATTAVNMAALMQGAGILRVHDVKEAVECVKIFTSLKMVNGKS